MATTPTEEWLDTSQIADMFDVTVTAVGNWFRKGLIPADHAKKVQVRRRNGLIGMEWRARASFIRENFEPPNPSGGRPKTHR